MIVKAGPAKENSLAIIKKIDGVIFNITFGLTILYFI